MAEIKKKLLFNGKYKEQSEFTGFKSPEPLNLSKKVTGPFSFYFNAPLLERECPD